MRKRVQIVTQGKGKRSLRKQKVRHSLYNQVIRRCLGDLGVAVRIEDGLYGRKVSYSFHAQEVKVMSSLHGQRVRRSLYSQDV